MGPTPHAWGALGGVGVVRRLVGTNPACAGNTRTPRPGRAPRWDPPRMRGEHDPVHSHTAAQRGPAPRARGALSGLISVWRGSGTSPACAGARTLRLHRQVRPGTSPAGAGSTLCDLRLYDARAGFSVTSAHSGIPDTRARRLRRMYRRRVHHGGPAPDRPRPRTRGPTRRPGAVETYEQALSVPEQPAPHTTYDPDGQGAVVQAQPPSGTADRCRSPHRAPPLPPGQDRGRTQLPYGPPAPYELRVTRGPARSR